MITCGLMNVKSAFNKTALTHHVISNYLVLAAITETWMFFHELDDAALDIATAGFRAFHACHDKSVDIHRGGAVAIIHLESIYVNLCEARWPSG